MSDIQGTLPAGEVLNVSSVKIKAKGPVQDRVAPRSHRVMRKCLTSIHGQMKLDFQSLLHEYFHVVYYRISKIQTKAPNQTETLEIENMKEHEGESTSGDEKPIQECKH